MPNMCLSPPAGVLMGMSNSWATIPGFLGPEVVGWLTSDNVSLGDRRYVALHLCTISGCFVPF